MDAIREKTDKIASFNLFDCAQGNHGYTRVLLQLFGYLGQGKSSFINTCKYVLEDKAFKAYADVKLSDGGNTTARISYPLTDSMTLVDNRGCATMNSYESGEIFAQLGNLLPLDEEVQWNKGYQKLMERIVRAEKSVKTSDFIYPIFVYSVKKGIAPEEVSDMKKLLETARDLTGIFPYVVLTHKTNGNLQDMKTKLEGMGVERIFALENFTPVDHLKTRGRHEEVLKFFIEVIEDVKFRVAHVMDPEHEREKRKEFILKFLHDREIEKARDALQSEKMKEIEEMQRRLRESKEKEGACVLQ
ncbi:uncharacterized protein O3C94_018407 [Discoglossus pictus]